MHTSKQPTLSVVVPTCGRATLKDTLDSIAAQRLVEGDEVIVVGDGTQHSRVRTLVESYPFARYLVHGPTRNFGNAQRNFALRVCHGDFITFMDDDDVYTEEAFVKIRKAVMQRPCPLPHVFKVVAPWGEVVWTEKGLMEQGNCCTIQLVVPNEREELPKWGPRQGANIPWMKEVDKRWGVTSWREEIIAICRPQERWWQRDD